MSKINVDVGLKTGQFKSGLDQMRQESARFARTTEATVAGSGRGIAAAMRNQAKSTAAAFRQAEREITALRQAEAKFETQKAERLERISGLISKIALVTIGAATAGATFAIKQAASFETLEAQFGVLLGSTALAKQRLEELAKFAAATPFELGEIAEASRQLEVLTRGALASGDGLRIVGDLAAGTGASFEEMARHVGRLYDGLQSGRPVGEAMQRLQELGIISGDTRAQIEALQKQGGSFDEVWGAAQAAFERFAGSMETRSQTMQGKASTLMDAIKQLARGFGEDLSPAVKSSTSFLTRWTEKLTEAVARARAAEPGLMRLKALFNFGPEPLDLSPDTRERVEVPGLTGPRIELPETKTTPAVDDEDSPERGSSARTQQEYEDRAAAARARAASAERKLMESRMSDEEQLTTLIRERAAAEENAKFGLTDEGRQSSRQRVAEITQELELREKAAAQRAAQREQEHAVEVKAAQQSLAAAKAEFAIEQLILAGHTEKAEKLRIEFEYGKRIQDALEAEKKAREENNEAAAKLNAELAVTLQRQREIALEEQKRAAAEARRAAQREKRQKLTDNLASGSGQNLLNAAFGQAQTTIRNNPNLLAGGRFSPTDIQQALLSGLPLTLSGIATAAAQRDAATTGRNLTFREQLQFENQRRQNIVPGQNLQGGAFQPINRFQETQAFNSFVSQQQLSGGASLKDISRGLDSVHHEIIQLRRDFDR